MPISKWLRDKISDNVPFDQIVRELITAEGGTFANPPANYYRVARDPNALAETTAQLFFGIRMQCAKCHNHPFERWTQDDYYSMAAFFAQVKQKADPKDPGDPKKKDGRRVHLPRHERPTSPTRAPAGRPSRASWAMRWPRSRPTQDRRQALAAWMTVAAKPFLAKSTVNRIWFHINGRGIVDPVDDFRDSNPSANDDLLDALAKDFVGQEVRHQARHPHHHEVADLSAQRPDQRVQQGRQQIFLACR